MRSKKSLVLGIVLLFGTAGVRSGLRQIEVPLNYSYMRFNPENSHIISGLPLNGGEAGWQSTLNHWIGIQGDFQGYAASTGPSFSLQPLIARAPQVVT